MKNIGIIIAILVALCVLYYFAQDRAHPIAVPETPGNMTKISIQNVFSEKVVYTDHVDTDQTSLRLDCDERGGVFNTCGSVCPKTAEMCTDQCAFTCELADDAPGF